MAGLELESKPSGPNLMATGEENHVNHTEVCSVAVSKLVSDQDRGGKTG